MSIKIDSIKVLLILSIIVTLELVFINLSWNSKKIVFDSDEFRSFKIMLNEKENNLDKIKDEYVGFKEKDIIKATNNLVNINKKNNVISKIVIPKISSNNIIYIFLKNIVNKEIYEKCSNILNDLKYFPVALTDKKNTEVDYNDSWNNSRQYGGNRVHEGTDIMAINNKAGYYPIISISDGIVEKMGWLELGGYRIGIRTKSGIYLYYAHLDSYAEGIHEGYTIKAGELIGFMGDSGYGEEGTRGKFDVHLHLGIYFDYKGKEISINPFYILCYLEKFKIYYHLYK